MNHGVHDFGVAEAVAGARAGQQIGRVGHGLHAAGDDDFALAEHHALRRQRHGFEARAAHLIDGHRGDALMQSAAERGLARRILSQPGLEHVAHDDFVDGRRLDARAAHCFGDDFGAELRGGKRRQRRPETCPRACARHSKSRIARGLPAT